MKRSGSMDHFEELKRKLEAFIRRYYINELLKGFIFFISIGLLYFIATLLIEHFLWLDSTGRSILFWSFVIVEIFLFGRFIVFPLLKLFRLSKGINYAQASKIIGNHFPEVSDKLLNLLQLKSNSAHSELLLAGIDQKSRELKPVPFNLAVDFRSNLPFLKYAAIPVGIILLIIFTGNANVFADSYERVVHYKKAYVPPAPFAFQLMNQDLKVIAGEPYRIQVRTIGNILPENVSVNYEGQTYFLNAVGPGQFEYTFDLLERELDFYFSANGVTSEKYRLEVVEVPQLKDFEMHLDYPDYTGLEDNVQTGSGNVNVPEGTTIDWRIRTAATNRVTYKDSDTTLNFNRENDLFLLQKEVWKDMGYQVSTSNDGVKDYEKLNYSVHIVRDQYPELDLQHSEDSLEGDDQYFFGKVSDDYGVARVELVYYSAGNPRSSERITIPISGGTYIEFLNVFPDTLSLERGQPYDFFFRVFDNDAVNGSKSVKSRVFQYRRKTAEEVEEEKLVQQQDAIKGLNNSLGDMELSKQQLEELSRLQKQKQDLNYSDRKKLENFLNRQQQQNELMKQYSEKLKKGLEENEPEEKSGLKNELEDRIKRKEEKLEENEKLLEELRKYGEKISQEELGQKLEELSKNRQNQERSLEQLLELTKKYYVEEKAAKISRDLEKLASEQERLAESEDGNSKEAQDSLTEEFQQIKKDLEELQKENNRLKKPVETGRDEKAEEKIQSEQQKAGENLQKQDQKGAQQNQKNAAGEMMKLSKKMQQQRQAGGKEQMQEDARMLRQILDNLVVFSFEQEALLDKFKSMGRENPHFASGLKQQNLLKSHFQHVDDSLYSLALRNPMITEKITSKLTDIEFDLDKSLERLAQNELPQGMASQQYVVTGANDLAFFLSQVLGNMQQMMQSSGSSGGSGNEMQLPDIIQKQEELNQQMKDGVQRKQQRQNEGEQQGENGEGNNEQESGELFRIFQEQQKLRQLLEEKLKERNGEGQAGEAAEEMKKIEEELLENGLNERTLERMMNLEHKLLDLEDAEREQGRREERESRTARDGFENPTRNQIDRAKEYFNTTEILNRQTLPLRQNYKRKVREYFERGNN